jgi:hypothetical protein
MAKVDNMREKSKQTAQEIAFIAFVGQSAQGLALETTAFIEKVTNHRSVHCSVKGKMDFNQTQKER